MVRTLLNAPTTSPLSQVNVSNVIDLMIQLTDVRNLAQYQNKSTTANTTNPTFVSKNIWYIFIKIFSHSFICCVLFFCFCSEIKQPLSSFFLFRNCSPKELSSLKEFWNPYSCWREKEKNKNKGNLTQGRHQQQQQRHKAIFSLKFVHSHFVLSKPNCGMRLLFIVSN